MPDSLYHKSGVNNLADIPTWNCNFERWFDGLQFLCMNIDVTKFDVREKLELIETFVQNEAKGGKKIFKL